MSAIAIRPTPRRRLHICSSASGRTMAILRQLVPLPVCLWTQSAAACMSVPSNQGIRFCMMILAEREIGRSRKDISMLGSVYGRVALVDYGLQGDAEGKLWDATLWSSLWAL